MSHEYPINVLCTTLAVSASGYHAWAQRAPSPRAQANAALLPLIAEAHRESRQTYGSPRITRWLLDHSQPCGRVRVARLMRQAGLNRRQRRRFRPCVPMPCGWPTSLLWRRRKASSMWPGFGPVQPPLHRLGDGRHVAHHAALGRAGHGAHATPPDRRVAPSFRLGRPICQPQILTAAGTSRGDVEHEPTRQLL